MKNTSSLLRGLALLLLAGVFLAAALPKIVDPESFAKSIYGYKLLPAGTENSLALILPQLEAIAAIALFLPRLRRAGLAWIGIMLIVFIGAQVQAIARGIEGGCGCFGAGEEGDPIGWKGVLRNLLMLGLVITTWLSLRTPKKVARASRWAAPRP